MEYCTAKQAARRWGVSVRVAQDYCMAKRVAGAYKHGTIWMIPSDAPKPTDPRKSKKKHSSAVFGQLFLLQTLRFDGRSPQALAAELPDETCRKQFWLEYQFFCNKLDHMPSNLFTEEEESFFSINHLLTQILLDIRNGDYASFKQETARLDELLLASDQGSPEERANIELAQASISASLYDAQRCPTWLKDADFSMFPLSFKPHVLYVYTRYLHVTGQFVRILGVTEAALALSDGAGFTVPELYLMIINASVLLSIGEGTRARAVLQRAVALAQPYGLYLPFIENITMLRGELDKILKDDYPADYKLVMSSWKKIVTGWTIVHNKLLGDNVPLLLTLRELQIGLYLLDGLSYKDIAERMGLKLSTVNNYLQNIRIKLGVKTSAEVVQYIRWA